MTAALPGQEIAPFTVEITREMIVAYAEASGDGNPIHLDDDFARSVGLPGVIAHGMLQMGVLSRLVSGWAGDHRRLRRLGCRFAAMVRPGDRLTCGGRVVSVNAGIAVLDLWAENQTGTRVLSKGVAHVEIDSGEIMTVPPEIY
ncbi:MAG: MaoC/PaaZ C-terminal domain-containing protein [Candidatus Dormibacteraceae bacterium]